MSELDQNLSSILGTTYEVEPITPTLPLVRVPEPAENAQQDFDYSRLNYYSLIEKGNEALDGIMEVAKESQHPRAYEVAATMMKNLADMTDKLMILQKQRVDMEAVKNPQQTQVNVDKAVFVGSTSELLKKIRNADTSAN
jgi:hypothetical protein